MKNAIDMFRDVLKQAETVEGDVELGKCSDPWRCPLAQFYSSVLGYPVSVGRMNTAIWPKGTQPHTEYDKEDALLVIDTPEWMSRFIIHVDQRGKEYGRPIYQDDAISAFQYAFHDEGPY